MTTPYPVKVPQVLIPKGFQGLQPARRSAQANADIPFGYGLENRGQTTFFNH